MIFILSYAGMSLQYEVCLWTLMGLVRTIFDATLFKVNSNLKQVWHMNMPTDLALSVQRFIRVMISGIMIVQGFTVYVYLASYIVLLYPVFLEERPTLVLPWLLLAAIRQILCELTSLALGLGICVLMGASRPPCIKFVIIKIITIMPSLYMWMVIISYYHSLKMASVYTTFTSDLPATDNEYHDYALELALRRRCTKSLFKQETLRKAIKVSNFYETARRPRVNLTSEIKFITPPPILHVDPEEESNMNFEVIQPSNTACPNESIVNCQDGFVVPRDADRIMEQFVFMLLRVSQYIKTEVGDSYKLYVRTIPAENQQNNYLHSSNLCADTTTEGQPDVSRTNGATSSYLTDFPQIFQKKPVTSVQRVPQDITQTQTISQKNGEEKVTRYHSVTFSTGQQISIDIEETVSRRTIVEGQTTGNEISELKPISLQDKVPTAEYNSEQNIPDNNQPNTSEKARTNKQNKLLNDYRLRVNKGTQNTTGKLKPSRITNNTSDQPTSSRERKQTKTIKDFEKQTKSKTDDKNNKDKQNKKN